MRIAAAGLLLALSAMPLAAQEGRTLIERLPLDTPESAVAAFIEAFKTKDFLSAYYMMSPEAKRAFVDRYYEFNSAQFLVGNVSAVPDSILGDFDKRPEGVLEEVGFDSAQIFDNIMFHAEARDLLPFDLTSASVSEVAGASEGSVMVAIEGAKPATLQIETVIIYTGDWRIDRISWQGSMPDAKPWGVQPAKTKTQ